MRDSLSHRGPDNAGIFTADSVGLGHRRLSIIDLTPDGAQPMANEDGSIHITYNGEVYNFLELRGDLEARGHHFRSRTDAEVVLHLYEEHGADCVHKLRGIYAFAIWDVRTRTLVLARDRIGVKPLYYHIDGNRIAFASELRALLVLPDTPRDIDLDAVDAYMGMLFVPGSRSIYRKIEKLPPASYAVWQDGKLTTEEYWNLSRTHDDKRQSVDLDDLQGRLEASIKEQLVADVPLGVFLSGGIDSGLVTALASRTSADPVKTFTVSFRGSDLDEAPYARLVSEQYGTDHTEMSLSSSEFNTDLVLKLATHFDEPFADASAIPMFLLSEMTRRHVTVALAGDGGDELFAGYDHHTSFARIVALQQKVPALLHRSVSSIGRVILGSLANVSGSERLRRYAKAADWLNLDTLHLIARTAMYWTPRDRRSLYAERMHGIDPDSCVVSWLSERCENWPVDNDISTCFYANIRTTLVDDMLVKTDRTSMYHALEVRVPVLDHRLVEYASTLRVSDLMSNGVGKLPLRRLANRLLPKELVDRPKQGFHVPLDILRNPGFSELIRDTLSIDRIRQQGFFRPESVQKAVNDYFAPDTALRGRISRYQVNHRLWSLLMFGLWYDRYGVGTEKVIAS